MTHTLREGTERECPLCGARYQAEETRCPRDGAALVPVPPPPPQSVPKGHAGGDVAARPEEAEGVGEATGAALAGQVLAGRYEILRLLAGGGMGDVYAARQLTMDREVAVKVLRPQLGRDRALVERFLREVRAASQLHHPNTIRVFDVGEADGVLFMVLELLHGEPLSDIIERDAPLDPSRAVHLVSQLCDALSEAHARGVVHLDIKPENLHVESKFGLPEHLKLLDFGVSSVQAVAKREVDTAALAGTPQYMSPEQIRGEEPDARADIYAVGAVLHELLTGRPPFEGKTPFAILVKQLNDPVPPLPAALRGKVPDTLWAVTRRLLSKSAKDRPGSAAEVRELVARAMAERRTKHRRAVPSVVTKTLRFGAELTDAIAERRAARLGDAAASDTTPRPTAALEATQPAAASADAAGRSSGATHGARPTPSRLGRARDRRATPTPETQRLTPAGPLRAAERRATPHSATPRSRTPLSLRPPIADRSSAVRDGGAPHPSNPRRTPLPGATGGPVSRGVAPSSSAAPPPRGEQTASVLARRSTDRARRTSSQVRTPTAPKPMGAARDSSVRKRLSLKATRVGTRHEASGSRFDILASNSEECVLHSIDGVPPSVGTLVLAGTEPRVAGVQLVVDIPHAGPSSSPGKGLVRAKWLAFRTSGRRDRLVGAVEELLGKTVDATAYPATMPLHQELVYDVATGTLEQRPTRPSQGLAVADRPPGPRSAKSTAGPGVSRARRVTTPSEAPSTETRVETPWGSKKR